jgi:hypothetical protein
MTMTTPLRTPILAAAAALWLLAACAPAAHAPEPAAPAPAAPAPAAPTVAQAADTLAPGVVHRFEQRDEGPWAIHVVEVDPRACGVALRTAAAWDRVIGAETTTSMARRGGPEGPSGAPALVAVNADFFRADPPGVMEGPQVAAGDVVITEAAWGPSVAERFSIWQPLFGVTRAGEPFVAEGRIEGTVWTAGAGSGSRPQPRPLARVNGPPGPDSLALFNRFAGDATPDDAGVVKAVLRVVTSGDTVRAVVVRLDTLPAGVPVPADGAVLAGRGEAGGWVRGLAPGDTVVWTLALADAPGPVDELLGGFPLLLLDGRPVLDRVPAIREAFALSRHPRTAVAIRPDGVVLLVVVDGRQPGHSDGMTLPELTDLLQELGARDALNLDGGGSTALVLRGELVNRPSDPAERPVANALLVPGPAQGECP